jgi:hypothetical protein
VGTILCRYDHYGDENASKELAHRVKAGILTAIEAMASDLAGLIQSDCYLVPVPNREGFADNTLLLAHFVSGMSGGKAKVMDIIRGNPRASVYELKKEGMILDDGLLGFQLTGRIPDDRRLYLLDNVLSTGFTMYAAQKLIPEADILVHSIAKSTFNLSPYREHFGRVQTKTEFLLLRHRENRMAENGVKSRLKRPRISY